MKVHDEIIKYLVRYDIKDIFGVPTATISPLVNALEDTESLKYIIVKNEAAASYSAAKYAKVSGKLGVSMISGSVGLLNAMNGLAEARQSKSPVLIITGYVDRDIQGLGAIQELEGHKVVDSLVKYNKVINEPSEVLTELKKAVEVAMEYPRGPVHIALPRDIQLAEYTGVEVDIPSIKSINNENANNDLKNIVDKINEIKTGVILVGGGCRGLTEEVKELSKKLNWRIVTTTSGKGVISEDFEMNMGHFGFSSTDLAESYMGTEQLDAILVLGSQLGENATNKFDKNIFTDDRMIIRVDNDKAGFGKSLKEDLVAESNLDYALKYLINNLNTKNDKVCNKVTEKINKDYYNDNHTKVSLRKVFENITDILPNNTIYMNDIGESQQFALKYLRIPEEGDFECNINYGCMGSTIGGMGVSVIDKDRPVATFIGDGSFFMNGMAELMTAKKYNMKIVYFVVNNSCLSFVNRGHDILFGRVVKDFKDERVNIKELAENLGVRSIRVEETTEIDNLKEFLKDIDGPRLVELITDGTEEMPLGRLKLLVKK